MHSETSTSLSEAFQQEHEMLGEQICQLRAALGNDLDWVDLDRVLTELDHCLHSHFEFEETGGYMSEVVRRMPGKQATVQSLVDQHQQLAATLKETRHLVVDREDEERVRELLAGWLELLATHEATENELMQDAFMLEFGVGD